MVFGRRRGQPPAAEPPPSDEPDLALVIRARVDLAAFDELVLRYRLPLLRYFAAKLGDWADTDELARVYRTRRWHVPCHIAGARADSAYRSLPSRADALARTSSRRKDPPMGTPRRILVVEDDETVRAALCAALSEAGYRALPSDHPLEPVDLQKIGPALVVTDLMLKGEPDGYG